MVENTEVNTPQHCHILQLRLESGVGIEVRSIMLDAAIPQEKKELIFF